MVTLLSLLLCIKIGCHYYFFITAVVRTRSGWSLLNSICVFMFYTMLGDECWQDWQGAGGRAGGENHWVEAAESLVK